MQDVPRAEENNGKAVPQYRERAAGIWSGNKICVCWRQRTVWVESRGGDGEIENYKADSKTSEDRRARHRG